MGYFQELFSQDLSFRSDKAESDSTEDNKLPKSIQNIIDAEVDQFEQAVSITRKNKIPTTAEIPIEKPAHWIKVPSVICCFVDMEGSTKLSAGSHEKTTAEAYRLFTETAVRIFAKFDAEYIDVKGDGVFALFNDNRAYTALAATVTFKTFVHDHFTPMVEEKTEKTIGGHFGIAQRSVLVRKFGFKRHDGRTDRQNEVWAGKPINMAAKLASVSTGNKLWVSDGFYKNLKDEKATHSCGCPDGEKAKLWEEEDISDDDRFDFNSAYSLGSNWCEKHGKSFCRDLVKLDEE